LALQRLTVGGAGVGGAGVVGPGVFVGQSGKITTDVPGGDCTGRHLLLAGNVKYVDTWSHVKPVAAAPQNKFDERSK